MTMRKSQGDMFHFVTHTLNIIKGKCEHECSYCYMKLYPQSSLRLDTKLLNNDLGEGKSIFVGSSTDMFAENVPSNWIKTVITYLKQYDNTYLLQTKNPRRYNEFLKDFTTKDSQQRLGESSLKPTFVLGTTIETNRPELPTSKAPKVDLRAEAMRKLDLKKTVTIEPIMDFDLTEFVEMIKSINPEFVSIGAVTKGFKVEEPNPSKVLQLINELEKITRVELKSNLNRLLPVKSIVNYAPAKRILG